MYYTDRGAGPFGIKKESEICLSVMLKERDSGFRGSDTPLHRVTARQRRLATCGVIEGTSSVNSSFGLTPLGTMLACSTPLREQRNSLGQLAGVELTGNGQEPTFAQAAEPGHLTLGELPGVTLDQLDGFRQAAAAFEVLDHLAVADGLPRGAAERTISPLPLGEGQGVRAAGSRVRFRSSTALTLALSQRERGPRRAQPADLLDQSGGEHLLDAAVDPGVKLRAGPVEHEHPALRRRAAHLELPLQLADRPARLLEDLQRPDQPPGVVGVQPGGRGRIDLGQPPVQPVRRRAAGPRRPAGGAAPSRPAVRGRCPASRAFR